MPPPAVDQEGSGTADQWVSTGRVPPVRGRDYRSLGRRVRAYLRGYERQFVVLGAISLVSGVLEIAVLMMIVPLVQGIAAGSSVISLDSLGPLGEYHPTVGQLVLIGIGLVGARFLVQLLLAHRRATLNADWDEDLRNRFFFAFVDADWDTQSEEQASHTQELLTSHLGNSQAILAALTNGWTALFSLLVLVGAALVANPVGALAITAFTITLFVALRPLSRRTQRLSTTLSARNLDYVQTIGDATNLTREIRTFNVAGETKRAFAAQVATIRSLRRRIMFLSSAVASLYQNVVTAVVLVGLGLIYLIEPAQLASLAVVVLILIRSMSYSQTVYSAQHALAESGPYLERLTRKEAYYEAHPVRLGGGDIAPVQTLAFAGVSYRYPVKTTSGPVSGNGSTNAGERSSVVALDHVSFSVARGRMVGIVGPSGSGKSTLVQLLLGLRSPTGGTMSVNGVDTARLSPEAWFQRVSFVPQEPQLLAGTVAENIVFRRPWVDEVAMHEAARRAHLHDEVLSWPEGYDTPVGERGGSVSGGQRQRICIARALVGNPDVIIFDEPTSALDVHSELAIQRSLEDLRTEKLLFIVAHRLSTLETCDEIMVLLDGRLQAFGPAAVLEATNPWFAEALELSVLRPQDGRGRQVPSTDELGVS